MHPVLERSFGGLSPRYYVRQFLFGLALFLFLAVRHGKMLLALPVHLQMILVLNAPLYPYSRFVYESVASFIVGDSVLVLPTLLHVTIKVFTMVLCWGFASLIAPVGLAWLYLRSGRH
ncbi:hypothetical protein [Paraburkholderia heleia]|uniref:hypothetical protein n=1 Tax=Paraburkholderia heleia TaxID=634127 RepID=UPI0031D74104